tara:strand:+ start:89 stop:310 length:222 start_codon:yes stop_codon:yes gene_type:complete
MKTIDLHGVRHDDATKLITDACAKNETPFIVITGQSAYMKRIVSSAAAQFDLKVRDTIDNPGRVVVDEKKLDN